MDTTLPKPEVKIVDMGDTVKLKIINAGQASRIFQYHIDWKNPANPKITFLRVIPPNQFVGVYNNEYIGRGQKRAIKKMLNGFVDDELIINKSELDVIMKQVKTCFKEIHSMVQAGKLRDPTGQGKVIRVRVI
jgi:hypothetical protein